jgi:predicted SprT family Zn-dependent metalloprotease
MKTPIPTPEQFSAYQAMYDYFNRELFDGKLPRVLLNFSRLNKATGFFAPSRWHREETITHEISLNPSYLRAEPIEVAQTLVHEMVHLQQQEFGKPSRSGYHNREWANMMEAVGLIPSSTGKPGGRKVGQHMCDYVQTGGRFERAFKRMPPECLLPWRCAEPTGKEGGTSQAKKRNKVKYTCPGCSTNVWGKPELVIVCGPCGQPFESEPTEDDQAGEEREAA